MKAASMCHESTPPLRDRNPPLSLARAPLLSIIWTCKDETLFENVQDVSVDWWLCLCQDRRFSGVMSCTLSEDAR